METLDMETDPKKIWDMFRQLSKDMGVELPEEDPMWEKAIEVPNSLRNF